MFGARRGIQLAQHKLVTLVTRDKVRLLSTAQSETLELLRRLQGEHELVKDVRLERAFQAVDRRLFNSMLKEVDESGNVNSLEFVPIQNEQDYANFPLQHPVDHAVQLEAVIDLLQPGARVLDCGCGSGYLSTVMALMVAADDGKSGVVVGVDRQMKYTDCAVQRIAKTLNGVDWLPNSILHRIMILPVDGCDSVFFPNAPFDVVRVGFALPDEKCPEFLNLVAQLKKGGRMIGFLEGSNNLFVWEKNFSGQVIRRGVDERLIYPPTAMQRRVQPSDDVAKSTNSPLHAASPSSSSSEETSKNDPKKELVAVKKELLEWRSRFEKTNGRRATRTDIAQDEVASALFRRFAELNTFDL